MGNERIRGISGHRVLLALFMDEVEIAAVNQKACRLPEGEHQVAAQKRINQKQQTATEAEIPKSRGDNALPSLFRIDPLNDKTHGKQGLPRQSEDQYGIFGVKHWIL